MKFLTRKLITPADLNPRGTLHGGQLLKWIDEEGGIHAALELQTGLIVTKYLLRQVNQTKHSPVFTLNYKKYRPINNMMVSLHLNRLNSCTWTLHS